MEISGYDHRIVRVTDTDGRIFTGFADTFQAGYGLHEPGREEEGIQINGFTLFASDMRSIADLPGFAVIRAEELWQQAGSFYVRIQAMAKKHHITLRQEFDEHDGPDTRYIVVTDHDFPIATARMYPLDRTSVMIGRVVVLPEYRHQGIGTMGVFECEAWADEMGYTKAVVESRDNKTLFYEQMGYEACGETVEGDVFHCIRMEKEL